MTSEPNREMSKRLAPAAINSIAQRARPIGIGHAEFLRNHASAASTVVRTTSPSILELKPYSLCVCISLKNKRLKKRKPSLAAAQKTGKFKFVIFFTSKTILPDFNNQMAKKCHKLGLVTGRKLTRFNKRAGREP